MVDDVEAMYRSVMDRVGAGSAGIQADRAVGVQAELAL
jgi:hypothetical protein